MQHSETILALDFNQSWLKSSRTATGKYTKNATTNEGWLTNVFKGEGACKKNCQKSCGNSRRGTGHLQNQDDTE
ncbi:hypothetical protein SeMB42_g03346 [Synchytrium endobioticum]|uniref:Uncharacterized protein n=1 Tax=Synchytrium endobioticum TaxID=286115 RepID=A0A507D8Y9_9FUNG|nr:hypothetical protein SeMB42_g03346 [Synchytrium endobioticum]